MKKRILRFLVFTLIILNFSCEKKEEIIYHEFEQTASDFRIVKWNVDKNNLPDYYLAEKIDDLGRVTELKFYKNGESSFNALCYLSTWLKYEYSDNNTVIEYNLNEKGEPESNIECELPSKTVYFLSPDNKIILKTEFDYKIDKEHYENLGWTDEFIDKIILELKSYDKDKEVRLIDYYSKSFSKLNGIYPTSQNFDISDFYISPLEKEEIEKILK